MKKFKVIKNTNPDLQFKEFFSAQVHEVPFIAPQTFDVSLLDSISIPLEADFAVATSGTTGKPKIYFRTKESWTDFFDQQNHLFNISENSRIFIHGSLAFTGNLAMAFQAEYTHSFLYISNTLRSDRWVEEILTNKIDTIYMIPDKLVHLAKQNRTLPQIKAIIAGSQFISREQFELLRKIFPEAKIILYYGTSETSYISYKILTETFEDLLCMGTVFEGVEVKISSAGTIMVQSRGCVEGIRGFYDTGDTGFMREGKLYLTGRIDDQINIRGEKINKSRIEQCLLTVKEIEECAVTVNQKNGRLAVTAHIAGKNLPLHINQSIFEGIPEVFIPAEYVRYEKLPRNESGKICLL